MYKLSPIYTPRYQLHVCITKNNHMPVSDKICTFYVLYLLAMCLHLYQHDGWGSGGTSSQLLCMHIYIHTHVAMIMNSIYIHICIITYMKEGQYICTINEHMCIFYSTHTYMYDHTYILGSLSQLSYCERRCGDITHLHR